MEELAEQSFVLKMAADELEAIKPLIPIQLHPKIEEMVETLTNKRLEIIAKQYELAMQ